MGIRLGCLPRHLGLFAITLAGLLLTLDPARAVVGPTLVFDAETGEVLIEERADEPWYPASLTKLMTAYLVFEALEQGKLRLDQTIPVSEAAAKLPPSKIGIPAGQVVKLELALQALLIHSANDMAVVLAEAVSGGTAEFVEDMNETAQRLSLSGTRFANPNGLPDPLQVTTARDMGLLARAILEKFPQARAYFSKPTFVVGGVTLRNRNGLLRNMPAADGMKTGFICDSGFNLVASATFVDRRLIAVVMGAKSAPSRNVLTQIMLETGAVLAETTGDRPTLHELGSSPPGSVEPHSMKQMVCEGIGRVTLNSPDEPMSWGVSFGSYPAPLTAEAVLTGRLLATGDADAGWPRGVVHDGPGKNYLALVWNMTLVDASALCRRVQAHDAPCEVMSPQSFAGIAGNREGVAADPAATPKPRSEGSQ